MTSEFDSFDESSLGEFDESLLGARNKAFDHIMAMVFIDNVCGRFSDEGYRAKGSIECEGTIEGTRRFDQELAAYRLMVQRKYAERFHQLRSGLLHIPSPIDFEAYGPVVPPLRFGAVFGGTPPDVYHQKATDRPATLGNMKKLFFTLLDALDGEQFSIQLFVSTAGVTAGNLVELVLSEEFVPWLRERNVTFRPRIEFTDKQWLKALHSALNTP